MCISKYKICIIGLGYIGLPLLFNLNKFFDVCGYDINTNRIKFEVDSPGSTDMSVICFSSTLFKEILQANKDATSGKLEVSSAGLARVTFSGKDYSSTYYLVQLQTA